MGCSGYLGPKKQIVDIYVILINQINLQALRVLPNAQHYSKNSSIDLYRTIQERITRRGYLKKLNDYLASHRSKIPDCFAYIYKTVQNEKNIEKRCAGIMIADSIVEANYRKSHQNDKQQSERVEQSLASSKDSSIFINPQNISSSLINKSFQKKIMQYPAFPGELTSEINARIDENYFRLINYLLENQHRIYYRILLSLQNLCLLHNDKFRCQQQVWKSIRGIVKNLQRKIEVVEGCHGYYLLLSRLKDNPTEQMRNPHHLQIILRLWLYSTKENQSIKLYSDCRNIVRIYINRCLATWDSEFIFQIFMKIYDSIKFDPLRFELLQNLYEEAVSDLDLKNQFFRGIFNYLLSYISVTKEQITDKKWFSMALGTSYQHLRSCYKNIMLESVKIEGFRVLNRWVQKKYIDAQQFVLYSSKSLIFAYTSNMVVYRNNKRVCDVIKQEIFKIIHRISLQSQYIFQKAIIEQIKQPKSVNNQSEMLIKLLKEILYRNNTQPQQIQLFLIPIREEYDPQTNLQIIQVVGFILRNLVNLLESKPTLRNRLAQFLQSLYSHLANSFDKILVKYQFSCACISLFKILATKYDHTILLVFVQDINQFKVGINIDTNRFFVDYLEYELAHILCNQIKVPEQMLKIIQNIVPQCSPSSVKNLQLQIATYIREHIFEHSNSFPLQKLQQSITFNNQEYKELSIVLRKQFNHFKSQAYSRVSQSERDSNQFSVSEIPFLSDMSDQNITHKQASIEKKGSPNVIENEEINDWSFREILDIVKQ